MPRLLSPLFAPALLAALLALSACGDASDTAPSASAVDAAPSLLAKDTTLDVSLARVLRRHERFRTFATLLDSARLLSTLDGTTPGSDGPYTVFAPTNAGLDKLPEGLVEELLLPANRERLREIVAYHLHRGQLAQDSLPQMTSVSTLSGQALPLATEGGRVLVGNERMSEYAVTAANGRLFAIDALVMPPVDGPSASIPDGGVYDSLGTAGGVADSTATGAPPSPGSAGAGSAGAGGMGPGSTGPENAGPGSAGATGRDAPRPASISS